jgi:hypothetical protein
MDVNDASWSVADLVDARHPTERTPRTSGIAGKAQDRPLRDAAVSDRPHQTESSPVTPFHPLSEVITKYIGSSRAARRHRVWSTRAHTTDGER